MLAYHSIAHATMTLHTNYQVMTCQIYCLYDSNALVCTITHVLKNMYPRADKGIIMRTVCPQSNMEIVLSCRREHHLQDNICQQAGARRTSGGVVFRIRQV